MTQQLRKELTRAVEAGRFTQAEHDMFIRLFDALDAAKRGDISTREANKVFYAAASEMEKSQWQIIEDLRTSAPESQRELAHNVADELEKFLREGSGNA